MFHVQFYRCFLSAGLPSSSPSLSRLVEAICILLCDRITQARREPFLHGRPVYTSRWKLVLSAYNSVRARLLNSQELLEGTNMVLYNINEATLVKWYKNSIRRNEITLLMQGLPLPSVEICTTEQLPPVQQRPSTSVPPPEQPHVFPEAEDTTGQAQAHVRQGTIVPPASYVPSTSVSRSTEWRHRKAAAMGVETEKSRKTYSCRVCNKPMSTPGHTQFRGQRYWQHTHIYFHFSSNILSISLIHILL